MPEIDFEKLKKPLSDSQPCGPDLDLEGDDDYLEFFARAELALPSNFFTSDEEGGRPYDLAKIDIGDNTEKILRLLDRTRDLRLLVLLARFLVFGRDLSGFVGTLETIASLLSSQWAELNPRAENGSFGSRRTALQMLDLPTVALPLQFIPLCTSRRSGAITYRSYAIARGVEGARGGESTLTTGVVLEALRDADPAEIARLQASFAALARLLEQIRLTSLELGGVEAMPSYDKHVLPALKDIGELFALVMPDTGAPIVEAVGQDGAAAIDSLPGQVARQPAGPVKSARDMRLALDAVAAYFRKFEPSSPVLPLVALAQQLQGKTFVETLAMLVPELAPHVAYPIGGRQFFPLPVERLSAIMPAGPEAEWDPEPEGEASTAAADTPTDASAARANTAPQVFTRAQALAQLDAIVGYLRIAEPSSPIQLLLARGTAIADKDFLSVLKSLLPENTLRAQANE